MESVRALEAWLLHSSNDGVPSCIEVVAVEVIEVGVHCILILVLSYKPLELSENRQVAHYFILCVKSHSHARWQVRTTVLHDNIISYLKVVVKVAEVVEDIDMRILTED